MAGMFVSFPQAVAGRILVFDCRTKFVSATGHEILTCAVPNGAIVRTGRGSTVAVVTKVLLPVEGSV